MISVMYMLLHYLMLCFSLLNRLIGVMSRFEYLSLCFFNRCLVIILLLLLLLLILLLVFVLLLYDLNTSNWFLLLCFFLLLFIMLFLIFIGYV